MYSFVPCGNVEYRWKCVCNFFNMQYDNLFHLSKNGSYIYLHIHFWLMYFTFSILRHVITGNVITGNDLPLHLDQPLSIYSTFIRITTPLPSL